MDNKTSASCDALLIDHLKRDRMH